MTDNQYPPSADQLDIPFIVKKILVCEARVHIDPKSVADDELLNGDLLRITSLTLLGIILSLETELQLSLEDGLLMTTKFVTVRDLVQCIELCYHDLQRHGGDGI